MSKTGSEWIFFLQHADEQEVLPFYVATRFHEYRDNHEWIDMKYPTESQIKASW